MKVTVQHSIAPYNTAENSKIVAITENENMQDQFPAFIDKMAMFTYKKLSAFQVFYHVIEFSNIVLLNKSNADLIV